MKLTKVRGAIWIVGMILVTGTAMGQMTFESRISTMYDDNILNNYQQTADKISTLTLDGGYNFGGNRCDARVSYNGAMNYYQSVTDRTNQFHAIQGELNLASGEEGENILTIGASYGQGFYRGSYAFYDHTQMAASIRYKHFLGEFSVNNLAYSFRSVNFPGMSDFSYTEHLLSAGLSLGLTAQTTLILQTDLGAKYYATAIAGESSGMRSGNMSYIPAVLQATPMVRIGQSIVEGTGLSLITKYQWNVRKQPRWLSSGSGVISDDEIFDDHYGYEGLQASLMLTQIVTESMFLKISGIYQDRSYSSLAAYNADGTVLASQRNDQRTSLTFLLQKNFDIGFSLKAAVDFIHNVSNDPFYLYRNTAAAIEFSLPF
jgi:hypothetical protein